jgi:thiamine biosynthesis protein ThiI
MEPAIILHHHEIVLKGGNRKHFEKVLMRNIRAVAAADGAQFTLSGGYGKFTLLPDSGGYDENLIARLRNVFGLANVCPGVRVAQEIDAITAAAVSVLAGEEFRTIRVETRRVDKRFAMKSMEVNAAVGEVLCDKFGVRANLSRPDATVSVEIVDGVAYVYSRRLRAAGGLPSGVSGRLVGLLSAGFDSPVACWRMMKRGCNVSLVHFHSMPYTARRSVDQVRDIARILTTYQHRTRLFIVPFAPLQNEIVQRTDPSLRILLYRRMMMRIAEKIAFREGAEGLVTGEAVGQVASQTLRNIRVIDAAATLPVLRPLSGSDKEEIIATAREIGTHDISSEPYDDCCSFLAPRKPATWAEPGDVAEAEKNLGIGAMVESALSLAEMEKFDFPAGEGSEPLGERAGHAAEEGIRAPSTHA